MASAVDNGTAMTAVYKSGDDEFSTARRRNVGFKDQGVGGEQNSQDELDSSTEDDASSPYDKRQSSRFSTILRRFYKIICITKGKRYGNYLLALFVFVKLAYAVNSLAQLFILNHFLGNDFLLLGFEVISKIWYGDDWTQLKRFPRVTMCDFRIREVGIVHRYTVWLYSYSFIISRYSCFILFYRRLTTIIAIEILKSCRL